MKQVVTLPLDLLGDHVERQTDFRAGEHPRDEGTEVREHLAVIVVLALIVEDAVHDHVVEFRDRRSELVGQGIGFEKVGLRVLAARFGEEPIGQVKTCVPNVIQPQAHDEVVQIRKATAEVQDGDREPRILDHIQHHAIARVGVVAQATDATRTVRPVRLQEALGPRDQVAER